MPLQSICWFLWWHQDLTEGNLEEGLDIIWFLIPFGSYCLIPLGSLAYLVWIDWDSWSVEYCSSLSEHNYSFSHDIQHGLYNDPSPICTDTVALTQAHNLKNKYYDIIIYLSNSCEVVGNKLRGTWIRLTRILYVGWNKQSRNQIYYLWA